MLLIGCSSTEDLVYADGAENEGIDPSDVFTSFVVEVTPPGNTAFIERTFGPYAGGYDVELVLAPPVRVTGMVEGRVVQPLSLSTDPPSQIRPVPSEIVFTRGPETHYAVADESGNFSVDLPVLDSWSVRAVPRSEGFPTQDLGEIDLDRRLDILLQRGAPLWGTITREDNALVEFNVWTTDGTDATTWAHASALTGEYYLNAPIGESHLRVEGDPGRREPTVTWPEVDIPAEGLEFHVDWPDWETAVLSGRLVRSDGAELDRATVRLSGEWPITDDQIASYHVDVTTDRRGRFDVRLPHGVYALEAVPTTDSKWGHIEVSRVEVFQDREMETVEVPGMYPISLGISADSAVAPASNIACRELDGTRTWNGVTDETGTWYTELPGVPVQCDVTPPANSKSYALTRVILDPSIKPEWFVALSAGDVFAGRVVGPMGNPIDLSVIRLYDTMGQSRGSTISAPDGSFSLRVALGAPEDLR